MKKKKMLLAIVAMLLVCTMSVAGTLAYLTQQANDGQAVKNTFIAAGGGSLIDNGTDGEDTNGFYLKESLAKLDETTGVYTLDTTIKIPNDDYVGNTYNVLPGVTLPKDPTVTIIGKTSAPAYLYVEVVSTLGDAFEYEIDDANWKEVNGATAPNGGKVYAYSVNGEVSPVTDKTEALTTGISILKDDKITVKDSDDLGITKDSTDTMTFYGYLAQTSITTDGTTSTDAKDVFNACFKSENN
jgi:hypothetical protein